MSLITLSLMRARCAESDHCDPPYVWLSRMYGIEIVNFLKFDWDMPYLLCTAITDARTLRGV